MTVNRETTIRGLLARRFAPALLFLCGSVAAVAAPGPERTVDGFQRWLDGTRQLEARFVQRLASGALGAGLSESGTVLLERPGRMRWEYEDPERKTALIRDGEVQLYVVEDAQLILSEVPEDGDLLPRLLMGEGRLRELFKVLPAAEADSTGWPTFRLRPVASSGTFEEVVVTVAPRSFAIRRAVVTDAAGNRMEYEFDDLRRNDGLPAGAFELEVPPETEVIRQ